MKRINFILSVFVILIVSAIPIFDTKSTKQGMYEWNSNGNTENIQLETNSYTSTKIVKSRGSSIKIRVTNVTAENMYGIVLYVKNCDGFKAIRASPKIGYDDDELTWDVSRYNNRRNGIVEIYAQIGRANTTENVTIQFFD